MKRKILAVALTLAVTLSLVACGGGGGGGDNDKFEYGNGADYIANNLKGDYSITYRVSTSGEDYFDVTAARTSAGYHYNYAGIEVLYIKNGNKYDKYFGSSSDGFTKVDWLEPLTEEQVKSELSFLNWMSYYGNYSSDLKKDGSETVAGRSCNRYKYSLSYFGASLQYIVCIDKATGICMKWTYNVASGGEQSSLKFECTEFKTSGVKLPAYN